MGLFDGMVEDFTEIQEFTPGVPAGVYSALIANVEVEMKGESKDQPYLVVTYTVAEGPLTGKTHKEFLRIVQGGAKTEGDRVANSVLKTRLSSFGVPEDKMKTVGPDDLMGIEGVLTLVDDKKDPRYRRVNAFRLPEPSTAGVSMPKGESPAAASSNNPFA